jgi:hypothetical protein
VSKGAITKAVFRCSLLVAVLLSSLIVRIVEGGAQQLGELAVGEKDGLMLTANIPSLKYKADEDIVISIRFTNLTDQPLSISKYQNGGGTNYITSPISLLGAPALLSPKKFDRLSKRVFSPGDFIEIPPGESYGFVKTIRLSDYEISPGDYHLSAWYSSYWSRDEAPSIRGLWGRERGTLHAKLTVNGAPLPKYEMFRITIVE